VENAHSARPAAVRTLLSVAPRRFAMKDITLLVLVAVTGTAGLSGCATVAEGRLARPIDLAGHYTATPATASGLVVHGRELVSLSSANFGVLEFTLENPTDHWVRIEQAHVDFAGPGANAGVTPVAADDIGAWQHAIEQRNTVRAVNTEMALDLLALGAAVGASRRHAGPARAAAVGVALGAAMVGGAASSHEDLYPDDHIYAVPIAIPPGLFARRWIVFNTGAVANRICLDRAVLDYETADHRRERVVLDFRVGPNGSEWQTAACRRRFPTVAGRPTARQ
jgi:hypothetical protein